MTRTTVHALTAAGLIVVTVSAAHAQFRAQFRAAPQIRIAPSSINTYYNPKEITINKPVPMQKPKQIVVVGSRSAGGAGQPYRANDRLRAAGPPSAWDR